MVTTNSARLPENVMRTVLVARWIVLIALPIWLALSGTRLLLTNAFLHFEYGRPDFPADRFGFTAEDRLTYAPFAIEYLMNDAGIEFLDALTFPDGIKMYNERELEHMADVKVVLKAALAGHNVVTLLLFGSIVLLAINTSTRPALRRSLAQGAYLTLGILAALVTFAVTSWDVFFENFHRMFFADGTWRFQYSDTLIRLFPERFWFDAALTIGVFCVGGAVLVAGGVWLWNRRESSSTTV